MRKSQIADRKSAIGNGTSPPAPYRYVDSPAALAGLVARMRRASRVALDTEADSLHHYAEQLCLLQLTVDGENHMVDPLAGLDLSRFLAVLADKTLVLHGADYDLRLLRTSLGFRPRGEVVDTMIAARLIDGQPHGLAALAKRLLGVCLSKRNQKSDWSRRPLSAAQLRYACDDTRYLETLADLLLGRLDELGRRDWLRESCERTVQASARDRPRDPDDAWRVKGSGRLRPRVLAFVRQLWRWRESEAQRANLPPFKILGNARLVDLALWAAAHPGAPLAKGPKLPRTCVRRRLEALERAVRIARDTPRHEWPQLRKRLRPLPVDPAVRRATRATRAECARLADELGIEPAVLLPRATVAAIARHRARTVDEMMACSPIMRWQAELLHPALQRILAAH